MSDFIWDGGPKFKNCRTSDGYELQVGLLTAYRRYAWIVYEFPSMRALGWSETPAPIMRYAQRQAEVFVQNRRAANQAPERAQSEEAQVLAQRENRQRTKRIANEARRAALVRRKKPRRPRGQGLAEG
jgi:hypothetical protein